MADVLEGDDNVGRFDSTDTFHLVMCSHCVHIYPDSVTCRAFPSGIPLDILDGNFDHTVGFEGDGGIKYRRDVTKVIPEGIETFGG